MNVNTLNFILSVIMLLIAVFIAVKRPYWMSELIGAFILLSFRVMFYAMMLVERPSWLPSHTLHSLSSLLSVFVACIVISYGLVAVYHIYRIDRIGRN